MLRTAWPSLTLDKDGMNTCLHDSLSHMSSIVIEMDTATRLAGEFQVGDPIQVEKYTPSSSDIIATRVTLRFLAMPDFSLNPTWTCYLQETLCK